MCAHAYILTVDCTSSFSLIVQSVLIVVQSDFDCVCYSDHYQEKGAFQLLMDRLRKVARGPHGFAPVLHAPLCA